LPQPVIDKVASLEGEDSPVTHQSTLVLSGKNLSGDTTELRIGELEAAPEEASATEIRLDLSSLPPDSIRAGVLGAQVIHPRMMGTPETLHAGLESNVVAFVLRPTVASVSVINVQGSGSDPRSAEVIVDVEPVVGKEQRVVLLLNEISGSGAAAYTFVAPSRENDSSSLTIAASNVKAGIYLVRLQVDGAESPLSLSPQGEYDAPQVMIPRSWL
jgi:hypothetical protein